MDTQTLINTAIGSGLMITGWFARQLWEANANLRQDLHKIEVDLPTNYLRRDEFSEGMKEIRDLFRQVFEKLDNKADK